MYYAITTEWLQRLYLFLLFTGNLIFSEEIESIRAEVSILKNQGINKIIALGHSGFTIDKNIALEVEGIDLVIGGHTNTFLYTGIKYNKF